MNCRRILSCSTHFSRRYRSTAPLKKQSKDKSTETQLAEKTPAVSKQSHSRKLRIFFDNNPHLKEVKEFIPEQYFTLKRKTLPENLYLIDEQVAQKAVSYILPEIKKNKNQLVCETNCGLGFISEQLLENGVELVRLYESCPDFKRGLKKKFKGYKGRVELFTKDIFLLHRYDYIDKHDLGNRVEQMLKGVPKRPWTDDPSMTIIGPLPNLNFIRYLVKAVIFQNYAVSFGRIQLYVFMRPKDYVVMTAEPPLDLHTYQRLSILCRLFFNFELLDKFPRNLFLPWQSIKVPKIKRYLSQVDPDLMYLVRINFKPELPVEPENLLPLHTFVIQFFGKGRNKIIPTLEKWVPGSGLDIMVPKLKHQHYFKDINIFTKFGELKPEEILSVFREMISHPEFKKSHFMDIIESQLIKSETIETSMDDHLEKHIVDSYEDKLDFD